MSERWKPVRGYEGFYEVSDLGNVRSVDRIARHGHRLRGKPIASRPNPERGGYVYVSLSRDGQMYTRRVHRLVLEAFVGPAPEGMEGCHNDGDPANNALSNLRWSTHQENIWDKEIHGTHNNARKTHCKRGHEFTPENTRLERRSTRSGVARRCRACIPTQTDALATHLKEQT